MWHTIRLPLRTNTIGSCLSDLFLFTDETNIENYACHSALQTSNENDQEVVSNIENAAFTMIKWSHENEMSSSHKKRLKTIKFKKTLTNKRIAYTAYKDKLCSWSVMI